MRWRNFKQVRGFAVVILVLCLSLMLTGCVAPIAPVSAHDSTDANTPAPTEESAAVTMGVNQEAVPLESAEEKIQNAMTAAPASIAENATIVDWPTEAGAALTELRAGTNGWVCLPDWTMTPTNDPMCLDAVWQAWFSAFGSGTEPEVTQLGVAYMLMGATNASNTDPFATEPPAGEEWIVDPPHLMLLIPGGFDPEIYSTDHHSGGPYVMWEGTPYEHMMVPLTDHNHHE